MVNCVVASCKNSSAKTSKSRGGVTFHRFPQDKRRRKVWEIAVNREPEWSPTDSSTVCSEHFEVNDFYFTESGLRRLAVDAIPALNISPLEDTKPSVEVSQPDDITPKDSEEVIQLKHKIHRLQIIVRNRKRQVNVLLQSKKRMKKKIDEMKDIIDNLLQVREKENKVLDHQDSSVT